MIPLQSIQRLSHLNPAKADDFIRRHGQRQVFIWSAEHRAYWRPERCGYTTHATEAGVYSLADAYDTTSHCGPEKLIYYVSP